VSNIKTATRHKNFFRGGGGVGGVRGGDSKRGSLIITGQTPFVRTQKVKNRLDNKKRKRKNSTVKGSFNRGSYNRRDRGTGPTSSRLHTF